MAVVLGRDLAGSHARADRPRQDRHPGRQVAKAFDMDVMAWSPHLTEERADAAGVRLAA